jgi:hypothetical protein
VGNAVMFSGEAEDEGQRNGYRIRVEDNGEPGRGRDVFSIDTDRGFVASGVLVRGNIQYHPGP